MTLAQKQTHRLMNRGPRNKSAQLHPETYIGEKIASSVNCVGKSGYYIEKIETSSLSVAPY
jgi:hypothetical protein